MVTSLGCCYSIIRGADSKVEAANHRLEVNNAVERVKKEISNTTEDVRYLPTLKSKS